MGTNNNEAPQLNDRLRMNVPFLTPDATKPEQAAANLRHQQQKFNELPIDTGFLWMFGSALTPSPTGVATFMDLSAPIIKAADGVTVDGDFITVERAGWYDIEWTVINPAPTGANVWWSGIDTFDPTITSPYPPTNTFNGSDQLYQRDSGAWCVPIGAGGTVQVFVVQTGPSTINTYLEQLVMSWKRPYRV